MWGRKDKVWIHYRKDIMAVDAPSAIFLAGILRHNAIHKIYTQHIEVIDLQKYKVITKPVKVRIALKERMDIPFIFAVGRN